MPLNFAFLVGLNNNCDVHVNWKCFTFLVTLIELLEDIMNLTTCFWNKLTCCGGSRFLYLCGPFHGSWELFRMSCDL